MQSFGWLLAWLMTLPPVSRPVGRHQARHDDRQIKYPDHILNTSDQTDVGVDRGNDACAHTAQSIHAEVKKRAALGDGNLLIERLIDHPAQQKIELGKGDGNDQVADKCFGQHGASHHVHREKSVKDDE